MAGRIGDAAGQAQGAFVLVAGLLVLGLVAERDGVFAWASARLLHVTRRPRRLLMVALALVAAVTAVLNLDTAVVFLTPILIGAARGIGADEEPFLYGTVLMANAASLLLPGANLTNLLVLSGEHVSGATFAVRVLPPAIAAAVVTAAGLVLVEGRRLREHTRVGPSGPPETGSVGPPRPGGVAVCALAAALVLALPHPAWPVLGLAVATAAVRARQRRLALPDVVEAVGPLVLVALFTLSVALGTLARTWTGPTDLVASASPWATCGLAALTAIAVNNLPAAVLLSAAPPPHPRALLLGLNLGPNLAVTGSLSSYLWFRAARSCGAQPSARRFTTLGAPLAIAAMAAGLATMVIGARA